MVWNEHYFNLLERYFVQWFITLKLFMVGPRENRWRQRWQNVFRYGGDRVYAVGRKVSASMLAIQRPSQWEKWVGMCEKWGKSELYLAVKLSHLYIGGCKNNCLREMRRIMQRKLATHVRCSLHGGVFQRAACMRVRVYIQAMRVDPVVLLSTCRRTIGPLACP